VAVAVAAAVSAQILQWAKQWLQFSYGFYFHVFLFC